jgi:hypothetical protein
MVHVDNNGEVYVDRLNVSTALNVKQTLTVTAGATTGDLRAQGKLQVTGDALVEGNVEFSKALNVKGDSLKVNDLEVVRSSEKLRIIRGSVRHNGDIVQGAGFKVVRHTTQGNYFINFDLPFVSTPTVVANQAAFIGELGPWDNQPSTHDNALVLGATTKQALVRLGDGVGAGAWRNFHFIAIGW